MENNNDQLSRYFKEKLGRFEQVPTDIVWNKINEKLGHQQKKRSIYLFSKIAAGIAIFVSTILAYYWISQRNSSVQESHPALSTVIELPPGDSLARKRPEKIITKENKNEFSKKSDRLEPMRKIKKIPALSEPEPADMKPASVNYESNISGRTTSSPLHSLTNYKSKEGKVIQMSKELSGPFLTISKPEVFDNETQIEVSSSLSADNPYLTTNNQWTVGAELAPLYSYRTISSKATENSMFQDVNDIEQGIMAYAAGIRVKYQTGRRLSVHTGLYYSRYGQEKSDAYEVTQLLNSFLQSGDETLVYIIIPNSVGNINSSVQEDHYIIFNNLAAEISEDPKEYFTSDGNVVFSQQNIKEIDFTVRQNFDYLEFPVLLYYKILDRKLDFSFSGGLITNILVNNNLYIIQNGSKTNYGKTDNIKQINYVCSFGIGIEYPLSSVASINLEPRFRYYLNSINESDQLKVNPYSFGLYAGISYAL